jgi:hypothetical protein
MNDVRETIAELDELIKSGDFGEREVELFKKLRGQLVGRDTAVEKIEAFRAEFEKACDLFAEANAAVHAADDYASGIDAGIADSIDKHLRAVDRLCRFGCGDGFGCEHHIAE